MIIREQITDTLIKTYSDEGKMILRVETNGLYEEAIDPIHITREYVETDIMIPTEDEVEQEVEPTVDHN